MDFRRILKLKPRELPVHLCKSKSSPDCLYNFIQTNHEQTMCLKCLESNDLLDAHPFLDFEDPNIGVYLFDPEDDSRVCQL